MFAQLCKRVSSGISILLGVSVFIFVFAGSPANADGADVGECEEVSSNMILAQLTSDEDVENMTEEEAFNALMEYAEKGEVTLGSCSKGGCGRTCPAGKSCYCWETPSGSCGCTPCK